MYKLLHTTIYENTIATYLYVLCAILIALALKRIISRYFATVLFKLVARTGKKLNKLAFVSLIIHPLEKFLFLFISFVALDKLNYPSDLNFKIYRTTFFQSVDTIATSTLVILFTWLCLRVIDFIALILEEIAEKTKDQTESQLIIFFKDFFKMIIGIIGFLLVLRIGFNKDVGNLITGLSIVGAAIALATKESLENLIASFIIFFDRPFTVGDSVKVNNLTGKIEKIGLRSTRIRTEEKTYISVPNKQMVDSIVDNLSLRSERKVVVHLEISLSVTAPALQELCPAIRQLLFRQEIVNFSVFLKDTGKHAHLIDVEYYSIMEQALPDFNQMREDINLSIISLLEKRNIPLAASTQGVVFVNK